MAYGDGFAAFEAAMGPGDNDGVGAIDWAELLKTFLPMLLACFAGPPTPAQLRRQPGAVARLAVEFRNNPRLNLGFLEARQLARKCCTALARAKDADVQAFIDDCYTQ